MYSSFGNVVGVEVFNLIYIKVVDIFIEDEIVVVKKKNKEDYIYVEFKDVIFGGVLKY